jgi:hypothetical protein
MNAPPGHKKGKAFDGATSKALRKERNPKPQCSPKSTATEAQRERILAALRRRPQTTSDLRQIGIFQAATRIKELRDRFGYRIDTTRVTLVDPDGFTHVGAALYSLVDEQQAHLPGFRSVAAESGRGT